MRLRTLWMGAAALLAAGVGHAETRVDLNISIGNAPPPPVVVVREEPRVVFVPEARVYIAQGADYDWFRVGTTWYIERDGFWYRADRYRGPYRVIEERYVPAVVWKVPKRHWRHHPHGAPPGQAKKAYAKESERGNGKGNGKGHR